jgi:hypothetical protein
MPLQLTSCLAAVSAAMEQFELSLPNLSEGEAKTLLPRFKQSLHLLELRARTPRLFRLDLARVAEDTGLATKKLADFPPPPELARMCTQQTLRRALLNGGAYPVLSSYEVEPGRREPLLIAAHSACATNRAVSLVIGEIFSRYGGLRNPFATLCGEFEDEEIREAVAINMHLFAEE